MKLKQLLGIRYIQTKIKLTGLVKKRWAAEQAFKLFCTPLVKAKRKDAPKNADPLEFVLDTIIIRGHRWNHPQPKKVLLLHGFSSSAFKLDRYASLLVKKGYEVLSFDAPAHGNSEGEITNALEYSAMIKKVNELYGPIHGYVAHSFGGIGLSLAMETLPHNSQTKIVFIAPATETTSAIDGALAMLNINDPKIRTEFDNIIFEKSGYPTSWFSVRRAVANITAQILWIHDEDDDVTPLSDALKVKEDQHSNIQFIITKGLGHRNIYHDTTVKKSVENFF